MPDLDFVRNAWITNKMFLVPHVERMFDKFVNVLKVLFFGQFDNADYSC